MAIADSDLKRIINLTMHSAYAVPYIAKSLCISYKSLWNFLRTKRGRAHLFSEKHDGLIWVRPTEQGINLIRDTQNSNYGECIPHEPPRKRAHWALKQARKLADNTIDVRRISDKCLNLFDKYKEDISTKVLHMQPNPQKNLFGPPLYLAYQTRFTSVPRQIAIREKYDNMWNNATKEYKKAVMITLTTDPKEFLNLTEANKAIQKNWNKLITRMRKDSGKELKYLCVREFQKNGRLHLHAVVFGIGYLINQRKLSQIWSKYGQGEIVHAYSLINRNDEWTWARAKPKDSNDTQPANYLKKYVRKAQNDETAQFQYWITGSRFYTNSTSLADKIIKLPSLGLYVYVGVIIADGVKTLPWSTGDMLYHIPIQGR